MAPFRSTPQHVVSDRRRRRLPATIILVATVNTGACGTSASAPPVVPPPPTVSMDGHAAAVEALYRARTEPVHASASTADMRFMRDMLAHHLQGREMVALAALRTERRDVQRLALRILSNYEDEITLIRQWRSERQRPRYHHGASVLRPEEIYTDIGTIPGIPTPEKIAELHNVGGAAFDSLFLELLHQHHEAAVAMIQALFIAGGGHDETVMRIVESLDGEQSAYVRRAAQILAELDG